MSHLVDTWKKGKARHLFGPTVLAMSCAAIEPEAPPHERGNPLYTYVEALGRRHCKTKYQLLQHLCQYTMWHLGKTLIHSIFLVEKNAGVGLLMFAWNETSNIFSTTHTIVVCADDLLFFSLTAITVAREEGE